MGDCCGNVCAGSAANATNFHSTGTTGQIPPGDYGNLHAQYDAIMADGNNHGFTSFDDFKAKAADAIAAAERAGILKGDTAFDKLQSLGDAFWQHAGPNGIFSFDAD